MLKILKKLFSNIGSHKYISIIIAIVLVVLFFIFRPKSAPTIQTQKITYKDFTQTVSVTGSVGAKNIASLTFPIGGTISWVGVKVGDSVTQNQTIATLDTRTALKNLKAALISYSIARNTFDQTVTNNGAQTEQDALNIAPNDAIKRILQTNQYNLNQAINSVELQDLADQQSVLWTPISGIITKADATTPGITASTTSPVFTVVDPNSVVFNMDVDEGDIGKVSEGQEVRLTLDAYPNETLYLPIDKIDFASHTTSSGGNAYTVDVKLANNSNYKYRVGMNGNADIITAKRYHVLTVPISSIVNSNEVYVQKGKNFMLRKISLGLQNDTDAVVSGLSDGDSIAIDPTQVAKK